MPTQTELEIHSPAPPSRGSATGGKRRRRYGWIAAAVLAVLLVACLIVFQRVWPFTRGSITDALQQQSDSTVQVDAFHKTFFPFPGCVLDGVTFRRQGRAQPLMTIRRLTIVGNYAGLLMHHISTVRAEGFRIVINPQESGGAGNVGQLSGLTIGEIVADGTEIEIQRQHSQQPLIFRIPKLRLHDLADNKPMPFNAQVQLPLPPADVTVSGKFGPWQQGNGGQTRMSGSFQVQNMDLGAFHAVAGTLSSQGTFDGVLQQLKVEGKADTPDFTVTESGNPQHFQVEYHAQVNGMNGDVTLQPAIVQFGVTRLVCAGSVAGQGGTAGKTVQLQVYSTQARVQDLLRMFVSDNRPPMTGGIDLRTTVLVPSGSRPFLDKLRMNGNFTITDGHYSSRETQKDIDILSARARGEADKVEAENDKRGNDSYDPGIVASNVRGRVALHNAVANLQDVWFEIPGAVAHVNGSYQLKSQKIKVEGHLRLDTKLAKATTGVRSLLAHALQPFAKSRKHPQASVVSVHVSGTFRNPSYIIVPVKEK